MGEDGISPFDGFPIQADTLLIKQAPRLAFTERHVGRKDYLQYSLTGLQFKLGHLIGDFFLLERSDKGVLCFLRL
jgi:hypothetical protein